MKHIIKCALAISLASGAFASHAHADPIQNPTATFAGLDKTTGRIVNFDVSIGETVQFGTLQIIPRVCNTRPQTETPQTTSFVEIEELIAKPSRETRQDDKNQQPVVDVKESKRLFTGWMFASSPGLHGVEHPVYDVWLVDCKGGKELAAPIAAPVGENSTGAAATPVEDTTKKKKSRKVEPAAPAPVETQAIGPSDQPVAAPIQTETPPASADAADPNAAAKKKKRSKARQQDQESAPAPAAPAPGGAL